MADLASFLQDRPAPLPNVMPREMRGEPLGQSNLLSTFLQSFGQPSLDALKGGIEGTKTPQEVARIFLETGPVGPFGMMAGRMARTADHGALRRAEEMATSGADRRAIWDETGWFQGRDGQWRFEIPDNEARTTRIFSNGPLRRVLRHPEMNEAYPDVGRIRTQSYTDNPVFGEKKYRGSYDPGANLGLRRSSGGFVQGIQWPRREAIEYRAGDTARSTLLHEAQHAIQNREGFGRGANSAGEWRPHYRQVAGEVEARNVQRRANMTPEERRARPPWETEDVLPAAQIVRGSAR